MPNPGASSASVVDLTGGICPKENYCPAGAGDARPCDAGTQQPLAGRWNCDSCTIGKVCLGNGNMIPCPAFSYCDGDTSYVFGKTCPNGFYGSSTLTGFINSKNCTACTETNFCTAGRITDQCAAGYICNTEADSPTPSSLKLKSAGKAFPCPSGSWCKAGAKDPELCPIGTFTKEAGGRQEADCSICPIGYYCNEENKTPKEC